jgi:glycosyltransferase involved in cell wall biosynthesis
VSLTILSVAYSLAAVGPDTAGGAEQVLGQLDHALVEAGHRSIVVALVGSQVAGELMPVAAPEGMLSDEAKGAVQAGFRARIEEALRRESIDLVHMHGLDFFDLLPPPGRPVLVTLHLPPGWYPAEALRPARPRTWFNAVSRAQGGACPPGMRLLDPIANGVPVDRLAARHAKRGFVLALGRICPEKGFHLALGAARRAGVPMILAGEVFRYAAHERYLRKQVEPLLGRGRRWVGPANFARKRRLLAAARCLLIPSLAQETSSLVAMEALACGTPVVAFPAGALPEIVEDGRTGFLVADEAAMAAAIARAGEIDPETCRATARRRFSVERMAGAYLALYERLAGRAALGDVRAA